MKKRLLAVLLTAAMVLGMTACGAKADNKSSDKEEVQSTDDIKECTIKFQYWADNTDYSSLMQDIIKKFNEENGTHLVSVGKIHYEPMGIYPGLTKTLEELPDGATIAVPNDATNEARALQLLAAQGLIELKEDAGLNATPNDITSNPKNLQFKELEAAMLPQTASEVDLSVINSNFAMEGGMNPATDSLASEDADSEAAQTFANIIAVKEGHENDPAIQALVKALQSDKVKEYIEKTYSGAVVAVF